MSSDKNILNDLLSKLLENRLKRLEKRNKEQIKDLYYSRNEYKKQSEILNKLHIKKSNKSTNCKLFNNKAFIDSKKYKSHDFYVGKNRQYYLRKAITPLKQKQYCINNFMSTKESFNYKKNNKYSYIKSRYREETTKISRTSRKLYLTPEPHIKKKKKSMKIKNEKKNINSKDEDENMKRKENINKVNIRNINKIKREENSKKRTIISSIDLDEEQITFVLEEKR